MFTGTDPEAAAAFGGPGSSAAAAGNLADSGNLTAWLRRGEGFVGLGEAAQILVSGPNRFAAAERWWRALLAAAQIEGADDLPAVGPVAFGSFSFTDNSPSLSVLTVPRLVLARYRGRQWITEACIDGSNPTGAQIVLPDLGDPSKADKLPSRAGRSEPTLRIESPGTTKAEDWRAAVRRAVELIDSGQLDKVVLARSVQAKSISQPIDPFALVGRLSDQYRDTWTFSVKGLLGASPELLIRSIRGLATSRVLAGTIQSTGQDDADLAHAAALARSSKDLDEHRFAVESVLAALRPFAEELSVPDAPSVLHLPNLMHLATDVVAELKRTKSGLLPGVLTLAGALHPSAAVCGTPTEAARQVIGQLEQRDRGRYAGPVGWIDANGNGEWAIALRCAQLSPDRRRALLWAGAGIVAASIPEAELAETEAKLAPMRTVLGINEPLA
jgi:menaquinone-specific isochorismate synthase